MNELTAVQVLAVAGIVVVAVAVLAWILIRMLDKLVPLPQLRRRTPRSTRASAFAANESIPPRDDSFLDMIGHPGVYPGFDGARFTSPDND